MTSKIILKSHLAIRMKPSWSSFSPRVSYWGSPRAVWRMMTYRIHSTTALFWSWEFVLRRDVEHRVHNWPPAWEGWVVGRVKGTNVIINKTKTKTRAEGEQLTSSRRGRGGGGRQGQPLEPQVICLPSLALYEPSLTTSALCTLCWLPDLSWYLICCCSCCCMRMIGNSQQRVRKIGRTWRWYNLATDYLNLHSSARIKNRCWWTKCPLHSVFHEYDDAGLDNMHIGLTRQGRNVSTPSHLSPHRTAPLDLTDSLTHSLPVFDCCSI